MTLSRGEQQYIIPASKKIETNPDNPNPFDWDNIQKHLPKKCDTDQLFECLRAQGLLIKIDPDDHRRRRKHTDIRGKYTFNSDYIAFLSYPVAELSKISFVQIPDIDIEKGDFAEFLKLLQLYLKDGKRPRQKYSS